MKNTKYVVYLPDARGFYAGLKPAPSENETIQFKIVSDPVLAIAADTEDAIFARVVGELSSAKLPVPASYIMAFDAPEDMP